jgi:hypothetical protein
MNIDIDEIQERIRNYRRICDEFPAQFEYPPNDRSIGAEVIHLTQALGALADAFIADQDRMTDAVAELLVITLFVLTILKQPASGVLNSKILIMEQGIKGAEPV